MELQPRNREHRLPIELGVIEPVEKMNAARPRPSGRRKLVLRGCNFMTCCTPSPEVPGFYLISSEENLETAYAQVPGAIAEIIESDTGVPTDAELENSYSEYLAKIPDVMRPAVRYYSVKSVA